MPRKALDAPAGLRQRAVQREETDASDRLVTRDAVDGALLVVAVDEKSVEGAHGAHVLVVHVHDALKPALLVVGVDRKVRARVELAPLLLGADPRLRAVLQKVVVGLREEGGDRQEQADAPRQDPTRQVAANPVHPEPRQVEDRERSRDDATGPEHRATQDTPATRGPGPGSVPSGRKNTSNPLFRRSLQCPGERKTGVSAARGWMDGTPDGAADSRSCHVVRSGDNKRASLLKPLKSRVP